MPASDFLETNRRRTKLNLGNAVDVVTIRSLVSKRCLSGRTLFLSIGTSFFYNSIFDVVEPCDSFAFLQVVDVDHNL